MKIKMNGYVYSALSNYTVFIDTCLLLDEATSRTWKKMLVPRLAVANKKFHIISSVLHELKKKTVDDDASLAARAKKALADIRSMVEQGLCEIEADGVQRGFGDAGFLELFGRKRFHDNLLLVTRDKNLARDILKLNNFRSAKSYRQILVWGMKDNGVLDSHCNWFHTTSRLSKPSTEPSESITCCDCNNSFELTGPEKKFYLKKGLCVPKRCPDCRRQKKSEASDQSSLEKIFANMFTKRLKAALQKRSSTTPPTPSHSSSPSLSHIKGASIGGAFGSLFL